TEPETPTPKHLPGIIYSPNVPILSTSITMDIWMLLSATTWNQMFIISTTGTITCFFTREDWAIILPVGIMARFGWITTMTDSLIYIFPNVAEAKRVIPTSYIEITEMGLLPMWRQKPIWTTLPKPGPQHGRISTMTASWTQWSV